LQTSKRTGNHLILLLSFSRT